MDYARTAARPAAIAWLLLSLCAAAQAQISVLTNQTIDSMTSDSITWTDSSGQPRTAVMAHDSTGVLNPGWGQVYGVAMRRYDYVITFPNLTTATRQATVTTYGNGGYGGFGYVVEHSAAGSCIGDDSPLGSYTVPSGYQILFNGRHHTIIRYTQNYPRNCPNQAWTIPVTIDWLFSTGRDNPLYAITYDVGSAAPVNTFNDDSRAPYGELNIDGSGFTYNISGTAWGDRYKFFTTAAANLDTTSGWDDTGTNTVPYIKEWINGPLDANGYGDATIGLVQTQTIDQQDAGGGRDAAVSPNGVDIRSIWTKTSGQVNGCGAQVMPCGDDWAYQANGDSIQCCAPSNNARMTWKTQFGFVGPATYNSNNVLNATGATPPGYPKKSYSVYVILGQHTTSPVEAQITQVETVQSVSLGINGGIGSVVTSGPAGINDATSVTYAPAGYNHIYGAFSFAANGSNQLDANITVGSGTLKNPLIVVTNYTGGDPTVVLNGSTLTADVDYFASTRANELWITLNRNLGAATHDLQINPPTGIPAAPTGVSAVGSPAFVNVTWNTVAGATQYELDRCQAGADCRPAGAGWASVSTTLTGSGYGDVVSSGTAYAYRVRAKNASGTSPNSVPDVATTVAFTDPTLTAGSTFVKAVHLAELRNALDLVRGLVPGLGAGAYTDSATAGTIIAAIHITEIRTQLDQAFSGLGMPTGGYTDTTLTGVTVKAVHFQELRSRVQ